jgi:hypothetical protein
MHGFVSRVSAPGLPRVTGSLLAAPAWQAATGDALLDVAERHVILCEPEASPHKTIAQHYSDFALACFERIQAILQAKPQGGVLVQIAVRDELFAGLSGLLRTAALENPQFAGQLVIVPAGAPAEELERCLEDAKHAGEPLIRYEQGVRQVLRWQEIAPAHGKPPVVFKEQGVYLITGGLGGLGRIFTKEILEQTRDARVILTGRSALTEERRALPPEPVSYRQLDLGDIVQVKRIIGEIIEEYAASTESCTAPA